MNFLVQGVLLKRGLLSLLKVGSVRRIYKVNSSHSSLTWTKKSSVRGKSALRENCVMTGPRVFKLQP